MSLYRKYRPQKFNELVGQDHIKTALTNALGSEKFSHAYLFAGPKGSGKTTTARLLAKALNCTGRPLGPKGFEPCEKCISCQEITSGRSMDVIEIDAASNRGIDEIRDLREKIRFAPTSSRFKVYVIDECHMLTKEAFNALLKTLEEPPKHAVFILATTELQKVPATILSRVQVFDFRKAKVAEIMTLLKKIAEMEKLTIEEEALLLIAKLAYGAYRDAVNMLDQVANTGKNKEKITLSEVQLILGQTTEQSVWDFAALLAARDRSGAIVLVEELFFEGKDLENFLSQSTEVFRKILLLKSGLEVVELTEKEKLEKLAQTFSFPEIIQVIEGFSEIMPKVRNSVLGQLPLEVFIFEFCKYEDRIAAEEPAAKENIVEEKEEAKEPEEIEVAEIIKETKAAKPDFKVNTDLRQSWANLVKIAKEHNNSLAAMLKEAVINSVEDNTITLGVKFKFHADQICASKNRKIVEDALDKLTGSVYRIQCVVDESQKIEKPADNEDELLSNAKEVFDI